MSPEKKKKSYADTMSDFMEKIAPIFDQPILASIRDGFVAMMPILIVGAFVLVVLDFPLCFKDDPSCYLEAHLPSLVSTTLWNVFNVTYGLLSIYVLLSIAYALSRRRGLDPLMPVLYSFLSYVLVATPESSMVRQVLIWIAPVCSRLWSFQ
jgi:PTS system cellobiose-specific IIC component